MSEEIFPTISKVVACDETPIHHPNFILSGYVADIRFREDGKTFSFRLENGKNSTGAIELKISDFPTWFKPGVHVEIRTKELTIQLLEP